MHKNTWYALGLATLLGGATALEAQTTYVSADAEPSASAIPVYKIPAEPTGVRQAVAQQSAPAAPGTPAPAATPGETILRPSDTVPEQAEEPKLGPTLPEDVKLFENIFGGCRKDCGPSCRLYGWIDAGYTYASTGPGLLTVEPRENRFGNEFLLNQAAIVLDKPLDPNQLSFGFNATFYAGADAALLRPEGGFTTTDPRFGADFRQLYVSAHLPVLTEGGVDVRAGRMGTIIGYESALAPYRPFYSNDYQWFYAQDGAFTGALATVHVNKQLDAIAGITMGANTFFTMRGDSPCFIGQVNYWTDEQKNTLLSASTYIGHYAIFAAPQFTSRQEEDYTFELRVQHKFNRCLEMIIQSDDGFATEVPNAPHGGQWYSLYDILIYHLNPCLDANGRAEWFLDNHGTRTGFATDYYELTLGLDYHPYKFLRIRPEARLDFADDPVWRNGRDKTQLTLAVDGLLSF
jgi:Putative beta-barrel porin-2, OmpL-like. bbp2